MFTVSKHTVAVRSKVVDVQHRDTPASARILALVWGNEDGFVAGINVGKFDMGTLPIVQDEAWGKHGRIFTSDTMKGV